MSLSLPSPIALYVNLENAGDTETLSECFAPNAIVRDEGRTYEGLAAITAWKAATKQGFDEHLPDNVTCAIIRFIAHPGLCNTTSYGLR